MQKTNLYKEARRRLNELYQMKNKIEYDINNAPPGKIHVLNKKGNIQYYLRVDAKDKSGVYISKINEKKISIYLQKSYNEKLYKVINKEIDNLESFLLKSDQYIDAIQQQYSNYPEEIKKLVIPLDISDEDYINAWLSTEYVTKGVPQGDSDLVTDRNEIVRSKTELNIANTLNKLGILYRYESPLKLKNGMVIYPDFTVLDVFNRRIVYWEHRGMMDDRDYAKHAVQRVRDYEKQGIFPGDGLIITEEYSTTKLGINEIESIIKHYLLPIDMVG